MSTAATPGRLEIKGELNIFTAAELRLQLLEALATGTELEVDLSQVSEIDSAGLQLLIAAKRDAAARQQTLRFTDHSPAVFEMLELCKLTSHLGDPVLIHAQP